MIPDPMAGEQTWPSEQELREVESESSISLPSMSHTLSYSYHEGEKGNEESPQGDIRVSGHLDPRE